jgi:GNAT superfamily N-acetyltransferase
MIYLDGDLSGISITTDGFGDQSCRPRYDDLVENLKDDLGEDFSGGMNRWCGVCKPYDFSTWKVFTALEGDKAVAVIGLYQPEETPEGDFWVGWFGVHRAYRKRGLGRWLLGHVIDQAKRQHGAILKLYTDEHNKDAHRLYDNYEFKRDGFLRDHPPKQGNCTGDEWVYSRAIL